jgi:hypothetical protein
MPTMRMAALGAESTPPEYCNGATPQSRRQFVRHRQQLHHFRYRIAEDDARRPTSAGLNGSQDWRDSPGRLRRAPAGRSTLPSRRIVVSPDRSPRVRQRLHQKAVWSGELFENGVMMAAGHLDHLPRKSVRAPGCPEFT